MSAGERYHWVQVQVFAGVDDGQGGQLPDEWIDYLQLWVSLLPLSAAQLLQTGLLQSDVTHRLGCEYRRDLLMERRALRVLTMDGTVYQVRTVRDTDGRRLELEADVVLASVTP